MESLNKTNVRPWIQSDMLPLLFSKEHSISLNLNNLNAFLIFLSTDYIAVYLS